MVPIDKGIPFSETRGRRPKYPWRDMEVGDSFLIATTDVAEARRKSGSVSTANKSYAPKRFCYSVVEGGLRIWRVE